MGQKLVETAKAYVICDKSRKCKDGTAPVRMIVKYLDKRKVYGLDIYLTPAQFEATKKENIGGNYYPEKLEELRQNQKKIRDWNKKAQNVIRTLKVFTFDEFEKLMFTSRRETLFTAFEGKIEDLDKQGRAGYASLYLCTYNSMRLFLGGHRVRNGRSVKIEGGKDIALRDITTLFLNRYEQWYMSQTRPGGGPVSITTVGIYMRNLRVILNDALHDKIIEPEVKPFGKRGFRIPGTKKRNLALKLEEVAKIFFSEVPKGSPIERYKDYWLFIYLTGGMNVADIASLRYKDKDEKSISYIRRKTALQRMEEPELTTIPLISQVAAIIEKWGQKPAFPESYIFPIISPDMNHQQERAAIVQSTKMINKYIKRLALEVGLPGSISTYTARHSAATIMRNNGGAMLLISEILGHSDPKTSMNYFKQHDLEEKRKILVGLIPESPE